MKNQNRNNFKNTGSQDGLNIIIAGCGKVGLTLVESLYHEGHNITIIDTNPTALQIATDSFDVMGIEGSGSSFMTLMEAGIESADLMIAVTGSDELNLLCCIAAKRAGKCDTIARVRNPDYSQEVEYLREKLGISMIINPELETAKEIARILCLPTALSVSPFSSGTAELVKFRMRSESQLCGKRITDISSLTKDVLICAVERGDEVYIPDGSFVLQENDMVYFLGTAKDATVFFNKAGFHRQRVRNTMIIGGGTTAYYLSRQLMSLGISVKIVENNRARCTQMSKGLPNAIIINANGTDEDTLKEEGIEHVDSFVPLTGMDEENIFLTLYAQQVSKAKVVTKINGKSFENVINSLDLGSVVYPRLITSEAIVAYVRAKKNSMNSDIETLYHMFDYRVEALEFMVKNEPNIVDIPLKDLRIKSGVLIAGIIRNSERILPGGTDCIENGDRVVVITTHVGLRDINEILEKT